MPVNHHQAVLECEKLTTYKIALLPGDGVGPEVMTVARNTLEILSSKSDTKIEMVDFKCGAEYYKESNEVWEEGAFEFCRDEASAILLGAMGLPGVTIDSGLTVGGKVIFKLRFDLDLYANVRPTKLFPNVKHKFSEKTLQVWSPDSVDFVIIRENTEGLYAPIRGVLHRNGEDEIGIDTRIITRKGAERIINFAFKTAETRPGAPIDKKSRVTCVDKSNVLSGCKLFRQIYEEVSSNFPNVEKDYAYIDAFTQWLIRNPEEYDVVVCSNLFGDILTDLTAVLQGGMGMAPSGNIGESHAVFEPVHGSAPKYAGLDVINPIAMISSVKLMFEWLGQKYDDQSCLENADYVEKAVIEILQKGEILTSDLGGNSKCSQMSSAFLKELEKSMISN